MLAFLMCRKRRAMTEAHLAEPTPQMSRIVPLQRGFHAQVLSSLVPFVVFYGAHQPLMSDLCAIASACDAGRSNSLCALAA